MKTAYTALQLCLFAVVLAGLPAIARAQVTAKPILHATVDTTKGNNGILSAGVFLDDLSTGQSSLGDPSRATTFLQRFEGGVWQITANDGLTIVNGSDNVAQLLHWGGRSDNKAFAAHYKDPSQQLDSVIDVTGDTQATGHLTLTFGDSGGAQSLTYVIEVALKVDSSSAPAPGTGGTLGG